MKANRKSAVKAYFKAKAAHYDDVDQQLYWSFSDALLWELLKSEVLIPNKGKIKNLFDAGAGTGRWGLRIAQFLKIQVLLYDISSEMLTEAARKIEKRRLQNITHLQVGDLDKGDNIDQLFDVAISFHNVLSFVDNPERALKNIRKALKKGAPFAAIVANQYHALYFSVLTRKFGDLRMNLNKSLVQFTDQVPPMHTFTPSSLRLLLSQAGFTDIRILGFPVTVYPNMEETTLSGNSQAAKSIFSDKKTYKALLKVEKEVCLREEAAARGSMLLAIATAN